MKTSLLLVLLLLAACAPEPPSTPPPLPTPAPTADTEASAVANVLSWDGYGSLRFGGSLNDVEQSIGPHLNPERVLDASCDYASFAALPGLRFMVENGLVTRGEAGPDIENLLGITVGMTVDAVQAAQPSVQILPHKYDEDGNYLVFANAEATKALVAEASGGVVKLIRAGLKPSVDYVEGCL